MMRPGFCWGFEVCPYTVFFPLGWYTEAYDTNPKTIHDSMNKLTNETVAMHLYSSNTWDIKIPKSKEPNLYTILAEIMCPKAYQASGEYFD